MGLSRVEGDNKARCRVDETQHNTALTAVLLKHADMLLVLRSINAQAKA